MRRVPLSRCLAAVASRASPLTSPSRMLKYLKPLPPKEGASKKRPREEADAGARAEVEALPAGLQASVLAVSAGADASAAGTGAGAGAGAGAGGSGATPSKVPRTALDSFPAAAAAAGAGAGAGDAAAALAALGMPGVHAAWAPIIAAEARKPYFKSLQAFLATARGAPAPIYPPPAAVYTALRLTPLPAVRVVILGQDPYHGPGQAHGLAFSVPRGVAVPPSLSNILKEVEADLGVSAGAARGPGGGGGGGGGGGPRHGSLEYWARQGVLLLNAVLTVVHSTPNAHAGKGWETFTDALLRAVAEQRDGVVFMLWGKPAQERGKFVSRTRHCVLEAPHPSPLSAHRGFLGCKPFSRANEYLRGRGQPPIDWCLDPPTGASAPSTAIMAAGGGGSSSGSGGGSGGAGAGAGSKA
jgi:uracil-DNA glycosylase